ncbi:hypothetical protein CPLU01_12638 [Colletotrichum plurivorum]|uniref:Uncharacterized protein n=1 Tax=Colletotrichum plurivorum TaxID=2175906 RepID=A0A8H6N5Z3_9PEZI|nr:hypothetical protein CPLU01_12638 [Colletotrichum plurivorum]
MEIVQEDEIEVLDSKLIASKAEGFNYQLNGDGGRAWTTSASAGPVFGLTADADPLGSGGAPVHRTPG